MEKVEVLRKVVVCHASHLERAKPRLVEGVLYP